MPYQHVSPPSLNDGGITRLRKLDDALAEHAANSHEIGTTGKVYVRRETPTI